MSPSVVMKVVALLFVGVVLSPYSYAASFNCSSKALSEVEKAICEDGNLSSLDKDLSDWYSLLVEGNINRQFKLETSSIRASQRKWIAERDACIDPECIYLAYRSRLSFLTNQYFLYKEVTSLSFIDNLLVDRGRDTARPVKVSEVIAYDINLKGKAEYVISAHQSMGIGGSMCGGGSYRGYWFVRYDFEASEVVKIEKAFYPDCGAGVSFASLTIEERHSDRDIRVFRDAMPGEDPIEVFRYSLSYPDSRRGNRFSIIENR